MLALGVLDKHRTIGLLVRHFLDECRNFPVRAVGVHRSTVTPFAGDEIKAEFVFFDGADQDRLVDTVGPHGLGSFSRCGPIEVRARWRPVRILRRAIADGYCIGSPKRNGEPVAATGTRFPMGWTAPAKREATVLQKLAPRGAGSMCQNAESGVSTRLSRACKSIAQRKRAISSRLPSHLAAQDLIGRSVMLERFLLTLGSAGDVERLDSPCSFSCRCRSHASQL